MNEFQEECFKCLQRISEIEDLENFAEAAEYKGKKVTLNKPFKLKNDKSAYGVYVKNPKTNNILLVKFGDASMSQHPDDPKRKASFRARHKCDQVEKERDLTSKSFWSCWALWPKNSSKKRV